MIITEILERNARMYGNDIALIERDPYHNIRKEITWHQFNHLSHLMSKAFQKRGIQKGDRVVQLMTNCIEWLPLYFGILRSGAIVVPLNFRFDATSIQHCVASAKPKIMCFGQEFIERIQAGKHILDQYVHTYIFWGSKDQCPDFAEHWDTIEQQENTLPLESNEPNLNLMDDAAIYFTSGTTGTPKGVLLTQRNLEHACYVENRHHFQTHSDCFLCIPPLYHTGAKMHWFGNFIVGAKAVILKGVKPEWILEAISEEQVTIVWLLVPWALDILFAIESRACKLSSYQLDQWRLMHIGAQPVPPSLIKEWKKIFPHHQYDTNYGLTESTGPGCVHLGIENRHKIGAIGKPGFDWETCIINDDLSPVSQGKVGELMVRGPGVMKAYYNNPEATNAVLKNGWLLTGDMAKQDKDGFIWLVDRKKDVIITGGENIYPVEIEDFIQGHPKIQDVAVVGLPSQRLGEIAAAIIQLKPGITISKEEIITYCQQLPRYKQPRRVFFDQIPRNPTGKIEKNKIRKKISGMSESFQI